MTETSFAKKAIAPVNGQTQSETQGQKEGEGRDVTVSAPRRPFTRDISFKARPEPALKASDVPGKIPVLQFVLRSILALRQKSMGIHMRYSRFNQIFRLYYGQETDPVWEVEQLEKAGHVKRLGAKGGAMLFRKGEVPREPVQAGLEKVLEHPISSGESGDNSQK